MAEGGGAAAVAQGGGDQEAGGMGNMMRMLAQGAMISMAFSFFSGNNKRGEMANKTAVLDSTGEDGVLPSSGGGLAGVQMRNLFRSMEECELFVHMSLHQTEPSLEAAMNETLAAEGGWRRLWHERVWYEPNAPTSSVNVSLGSFPNEALSGEVLPYVHALLLRTASLQGGIGEIPSEQVISQSLPLVVFMREMNSQAGAANLFDTEAEIPAKKANTSAVKVPYLKRTLEVRPVFDQTVHTAQTASQGPFKKLRLHPSLGIYEPYLYLSDFWLLEKDYLPLNDTLAGEQLNLTLTYSVATMWAWSLQVGLAEQWMNQGEWGVTDSQRDSFMVKRLLMDTNPYILAFSAAFIMVHTVFSMLAFKNDIQFWRKNESMRGLSARSMVVSFVCQLITALYLLDSQETSRLILFEILLDLSLGTWKLRKAVKIELKPRFPFVSMAGQKGYEDKGTDKYDEEALRYMFSLLTPLFIGYSIRSALYGKHKGWYSFFVNAAAGGVYTFGFVMMTPQLYINYQLQSVEHLPWRALTYKAMNTFVDDVAAFLIDMPMMHRLSCLRDDVIFFVYIYQRWKYSTDKTRPTMWASPDPAAIHEDGSSSGTAAALASEPEGSSATLQPQAAAIISTCAEGGGVASAAPVPEAHDNDGEGAQQEQ